jgi:FG-GAP-like repeat
LGGQERIDAKPTSNSRSASVWGGCGTHHAVTGNPAADFNGDGKPDIAAGTSESFGFEYGPNGVAILLGKGDGTFQPPVNFLLGGDPNFALVGDFNGDGKPDLAFTGKDGITVLTNTTP